ncbi:MAG: ATP-binding cassette domain-containing protein [Halocynthiibacter sp.]
MNAPSLEMAVTLGRTDFSLEVDQTLRLDGVTALTGPSASGKTTILRILSGLEPGAVGRVRFDGVTWQDRQYHRPPHKRSVGYVFQDVRLFSHLSVADNLRYGLRWQGRDSRVPADLIEALELGPLMGRSVSALSGGESRRVALGRALATRPSLMLLDEPLTGLDTARKARLMPFIARALKTAGCPAIYVSHDRAEISALAERILSMSAGRIVGLAPSGPVYSAEVLKNAGSGEIRLRFASQEFCVASDAVTVAQKRFRISQDHILISEHDPGTASALFTCAVEVREVRPDLAELRLAQAGGQPNLVVARDSLGGLSLTPGQNLWLSVSHIVLLPD